MYGRESTPYQNYQISTLLRYIKQNKDNSTHTHQNLHTITDTQEYIFIDNNNLKRYVKKVYDFLLKHKCGYENQDFV